MVQIDLTQFLNMENLQETFLKFKDTYTWSLSVSDKRVEKWLFMQTPLPTIGLVMTYLILVIVGPKMMESRPPFKLRNLMIIYNFGVMLLNLYIGVELTVVSIKLRYSWFCQPVDYTNEPYAVRVAAALWWYYFSKLVEFADTLFFILRKKNNQLTFLHVYHHSTMFGLWWIGIKWVAGGSSFLAAMMNSYVHVLMYAYYGLSSFGPKMQKYLWWKKHITCIQLIQFSCAGVLGAKAIYSGCDFPLWMQYALVCYMMTFIILFGQFYFQAYRQKRKSSIANGVKHHQNGKSLMKSKGSENGMVPEEQQQQQPPVQTPKGGKQGRIRTRAQARKESKARKDM